MKKTLNKIYMENGEFFITLKGKDLFDNLTYIKYLLEETIDGLYFSGLKYASKKEVAKNVIKIKLKKNTSQFPNGSSKKFTKEEIENIKKRLKI